MIGLFAPQRSQGLETKILISGITLLPCMRGMHVMLDARAIPSREGWRVHTRRGVWSSAHCPSAGLSWGGTRAGGAVDPVERRGRMHAPQHALPQDQRRGGGPAPRRAAGVHAQPHDRRPARPRACQARARPACASSWMRLSSCCRMKLPALGDRDWNFETNSRSEPSERRWHACNAWRAMHEPMHVPHASTGV